MKILERHLVWEHPFEDLFPLFVRYSHFKGGLGCVEALFLRLHRKSMSGEVDDKVVWMATKRGQFSVKSFHDGMIQRGPDSFPTRLIWNSWAPIKTRRNLVITSFFIVLGEVCYGNWSSPYLEWFGYCIPQSKQRYLVSIADPSEEKKEGVECYSSLFVLDYLEREE
ncbi:hypothetical protein CK203_099945 [Vitis vinifera]|uniref:Uncharacterized protein n=1 Tax=Vitis vinifera TaxID=29760 RepID=A0A438CYJ9_VITVI|nr:hypothetical protein CK203_099945 [Vitis vinifera]